MSTGDDPTAVERPRATGPRDSGDGDAVDTEPVLVAEHPRDHSELTTVDPAHYVMGAELARGGMGQIHAAHDRRLGRDVAIKELLAESPSLTRRFEREARITARLQHPSIVSVHEAGRWPDGKPFYAMRLVVGTSMHAAIKRTRTLEERIALVPNVLAVADAMAYAHSQRVIHRDLKPSNVILGEFGETVVIDWGLAKSVDDVDDPSSPISAGGGVDGQTQIGDVLGTPGYMSPEQASGDDVDERTDVYAIGAMLHHLLAGKLMQGPPPLAEVAPTIAPDLAAIVERALKLKLDSRYRDARALADDLRKFTTGQLVGAHRYSTRELVRRWLRRHRAPVAIAVIAAATLATVAVVSVRSIVRERRIAQAASVRAAERSRDAEDAMGFMLFEVAERLRQAGRLELMSTVVKRAADYYAHTTDRDIDPTRLVSALSTTGGVLRAEGDLAAAASQFERARAIAEARQADGPLWRHLLAGSLNDLGETSYQQGDLVQAASYHRKAMALSEALVANDASDQRWQRDLAYSQRYLANVLTDQGLVADALPYMRASFAIRQRIGDPRDVMMGHTDLGLALARGKDTAGAVVELRAALAIGDREATADPAGTTWQRDVAVAHERIGSLLALRGDLAAALAEFTTCRDQMTLLVALDSANTEWQRRLAIAHDRVGSTLLELGKLDDAGIALGASLAIRETLAKRDPTNARWQRDLSHGHVLVGDAFLARGDATRALTEYRTANAIRDELVKQDPSSVKWQSDTFSSRRRMGNALLASGDMKGARTELEAAAALSAEVVRVDASAIDDRDLVELHQKLAEALRDDGDPARAATELDIAIALAKQRADDEPEDIRRGALVKQLESQRAGLR